MLRLEHEGKLAEALKDMEEKTKAEAAQMLGLVRAQLTGMHAPCCSAIVIIAVASTGGAKLIFDAA